jgi:hypothetical protein
LSLHDAYYYLHVLRRMSHHVRNDEFQKLLRLVLEYEQWYQ